MILPSTKSLNTARSSRVWIMFSLILKSYLVKIKKNYNFIIISEKKKIEMSLMDTESLYET